MSALMVVVLTRASMLVELMSVLRFLGLIFAVMLVALSEMMSCVVMFALMLVVVMCVLTLVVRSVIRLGIIGERRNKLIAQKQFVDKLFA
mgnify:CR=1 FL=1